MIKLYISQRKDPQINATLNLIHSKKKNAYAELKEAITGSREDTLSYVKYVLMSVKATTNMRALIFFLYFIDSMSLTYQIAIMTTQVNIPSKK